MPYFKDIFKDLSARSDKPQQGINRLVFLDVSNLKRINLTCDDVVCKLAWNTKRSFFQDFDEGAIFGDASNRPCTRRLTIHRSEGIHEGDVSHLLFTVGDQIQVGL